jgi:hypothetical protein
MSRVQLLPRLNALGVSRILSYAKVHNPTLNDSQTITEDYASIVTFAASGGSVNYEAARQVGELIKTVASRFGFPEASSVATRGRFDAECAIALATCEVFESGEAMRDDVWAFQTLVLSPQVVAWRFPDMQEDRFSGGVRNAFRRLWIRGTSLDRGKDHQDRWGLVRELSEDAMVQIFERASIAGERRLARSIAEVWVSTAAKLGRGRMEDIMRRSTKYIRIRNEIYDLASLDDETLYAEIINAFEKVIELPSSSS